MANIYAAPWHRESYDRFLKERLPELLAERVPLAGYRVEQTGEFVRSVTVAVAGAGGAAEVTFEGIPAPDHAGVFDVQGQKRVVLPVASGADLSTAEVRCVGEQMLERVRERLGEAPRDLKWDESILRAWMPLDVWLREFIEQIQPNYPWQFMPEWVAPGQGFPRVQPLRDRNWLAIHTHLRRIWIEAGKQPWLPGMPWSPGQLGRVCPFETPEGTNIGKVASVAIGATIRDGRIAIVDDRPEAAIGLSASMIPLLEHDEAARVMMGANMMWQWVPASKPEPALVQTGYEPDEAGFWCGCNFLTAFMPLGVETFEDGIVISESAARRLASDQPVEVGGKLSNRHGAKGVISQIRPDEQMPQLEDGTAVDLVYSFIGLHTRLNFGQVREAVLGRVAQKAGRPLLVPPFANLGDEELRRRLKEAGLPESGMQRLRRGQGDAGEGQRRTPESGEGDVSAGSGAGPAGLEHGAGRDGEAFERDSTVGWVYWGRTEHLARTKLTVSTSPQRCMLQGEMEYRGMRDAGALVNIAETYNLRNAARPDAASLAQRVAAGPVGLAEPPTPMFVEMARRLAAAGIAAEFDGQRVSFRFTSPAAGMEVLHLAQAVRHPWLRERELYEVGRVEEVPGWEALVEANSRLQHLLGSQAPASLREKALALLQARVDAYVAGLLTMESVYRSQVVRMWARVMFSGKAVLAPPIGLRNDQVGLAEEIAWGLFGPMVAREMGGASRVAVSGSNDNDHGPATAQDHGTRAASQDTPKQTTLGGGTPRSSPSSGMAADNAAMAAHHSTEETAALDAIMSRSWVIINRAPTLSPTSLIAFRPVRIAEPVIRMPVAANRLMNADYDGDQAAVLLPITEQGQREAGEKLSLLGHLRRDPSILGQMIPYQEALWGLAQLGRSAEGLRRISQVAGVAVQAEGPCVTHESLLAAMQQVLRERGPEAALEAIEGLTRLGFEVCGASGASVGPFVGEAVKRPVEPEGQDAGEWRVYLEELYARVASMQEFDDETIGAQPLAVRSGARGSVAQLARLVGPLGPAGGADGRPTIIRRSLAEGLTPAESYALAAAMRERIGQLHADMDRTATAAGESGRSKGFNVLARASRSEYPGVVFAQAAASGEVDPLADLDARMFVGLRPEGDHD